MLVRVSEHAVQMIREAARNDLGEGLVRNADGSWSIQVSEDTYDRLAAGAGRSVSETIELALTALLGRIQ